MSNLIMLYYHKLNNRVLGGRKTMISGVDTIIRFKIITLVGNI